MTMIKTVAVIGSGTMGRMIAEHISFCGTKTILLDIVATGQDDRNHLANKSISKMRHCKEEIIPGNLEDDLERLLEADWVIEAIVENIEIKLSLYKTISPVLKHSAVLSSNTSTITRKELISTLDQEVRDKFIITHFFNPPRHLLLMELVKAYNTSNPNVEAVVDFCQKTLGRYVIECNDTTGFIGNRIGCYWLMAALNTAVEMGIDIELVDHIMNNRHLGIPKTGVFGLIDLIGLDVFLAITKSLKQSLPKQDSMQSHAIPKILEDLISDGFAGNKKGAGFYRYCKKSDGTSERQAIDLKTGLYRTTKDILQITAKTLPELLNLDSGPSAYAKRVWISTLKYAASLIPEISDDISLVDETMKLGYNWESGPFEIISKLDQDKELLSKGIPILEQNKPVYQGTKYLAIDGSYRKITIPEGMLTINHMRRLRSNTPIITNASASLWDMGDGVVCLGFTSRNNCFDESMLRLINDTVNIVHKNFAALVIANDSSNFSVGANLKIFLKKSFDYTEKIIIYGQETFDKLKCSSFPVVAAISGFTVGGGCELVLHCDAIQAYKIVSLGLVETNIGVIPGWGGCKEMLLRYRDKDQRRLFNQIFRAELSKNAEDLFTMQVLRKGLDGISNNRKMLIQDAKNLALKMLETGYKPPQPATHFSANINGKIELPGDMTEHDKLIAQKLSKVLICKDLSEKEILKKERDNFMYLLKHPKTQERIEHMLNKKAKLHN